MFRLWAVILMSLFVLTPEAWAMGFLNPQSDARITVKTDGVYLKNVVVKKDEKYFYISGDIKRIRGRTLYGVVVRGSLLNAQGQEIDQGISRISAHPSNRVKRRTGTEGTFFMKIKYNPGADAVVVSVK